MAFDKNDPADLAIVQEMIDAAVEPLTTKNKQLLGEVKTLRKGAQVDPADVERIERERDELATKVDDLGKQLKTATTAAETTAKQLQSEQGYTNKLLVSDGLNAALLAAGVTNPVHLKAASAMIRDGGSIEVKVEGDARVAMVGGKPLAEFVKGWSQSDDGKAFVSAQHNSGGGGHGSGGAGTPNPWAKDTFNLTEQGKIYTQNPQLAESMKAAAGTT